MGEFFSFFAASRVIFKKQQLPNPPPGYRMVRPLGILMTVEMCFLTTQDVHLGQMKLIVCASSRPQ